MTIDTTAPKTSFSNVISAVVFAAVHLMCLFIFVTGVSWVAVSVCMALYFIRMFAITAIITVTQINLKISTPRS
jgi:hypothetical protein